MKHICYVYEGGIAELEAGDSRPDLAYVVEGMYGLRLGHNFITIANVGYSMTVSVPCIFLYKGLHNVAKFYQHPTLRQMLMEVTPEMSLSYMTMKVALYVMRMIPQLEKNVTENEIRYWDFSERVNKNGETV